MNYTDKTTPADEVYDAAHITRDPRIDDLLTAIADDMSDENAVVRERPEWIGLTADMRWGVFACTDRPDAPGNDVWKAALVYARHILGQERA